MSQSQEAQPVPEREPAGLRSFAERPTVFVPFCGKLASRMGGRNYAETLIGEIKKNDRGLHWLIGADRELIKELRDQRPQPHLRWITFPNWSASSIGRLVFEQLGLPAIIRHRKPEVVYFSGNFSSMLSRTRTVLAVRSLLEYKKPQELNFFRRAVRKILVRWAVKNADEIVCPSDHLSEELRNLFDLAAERITTVPHGINPAYRPGAEDESILDKLDIRGRSFFVYPASLWAYKNHLTLVEAARHLTGSARDSAIVFAGRGTAVDSVYEQRLRDAIQELDAPARIIMSGELDPPELCALYLNAVALVFPSTCESFGNPVVESMAMSCPIIASHSDALPEVVGEGGILVEPFDAQAWAGEMSRLVNDPAYREEWSARAFERKGWYAAGRSVDELASVLMKAVQDEVNVAGV